jgi:hypothetical protein
MTEQQQIDLAVAAIPTAAELVVAVDNGDATTVADLLAGCDRQDLYALCVVLAAHVDPDRPFTPRDAHLPPIVLASQHAAALFNLSMREMRGGESRRRDVLDARAVAIYAAKLCDPDTTWTSLGRYVGRDHSTIIHAHARVGADARLRRIANGIADHVGRPETLDDLGEETG